MEQKGLSNFVRRSPKEHSCIIISKSIHWLKKRNCLKVFLFLALVAILFDRAEWLEQFGTGSPKGKICKIISKTASCFEGEVC